jgi:type II secretion system protein H
MQTRRFKSRQAFTLIEMVLVLLLVAIVAGIVAPTLRNFSSGARLRNTADQFVTLSRLARVQALSTGQVHRLTIDSSGNRCFVAVESGQDLKELDRGMDGSFDIPDGVRLQMDDQDGTARNSVEFYPNGRTQTARVRVSMLDGNGLVDVECVAPTEGFVVINPGVAR